MKLDPTGNDAPGVMQAELDAMADWASDRGLDSQDLAILCAVMLGSLVRLEGKGADDKQIGFEALIGYARHHANLDTH